jgi:hypothetical protein
MVRNQVRLGAFTIATQREPIFLGNNDWARGSYDAEFFNDRNSAQVRWLLARHPRLPEEDEVQKGRTYVAEAVRYAREHPRRQAWLVARRAALFLSPLRERENADNGYDWAFATVASLCVVGAAWLVRTHPPSVSLLALPVGATFATCLVVLFLPRYRYPCEPMLIGLASQVAFMGAMRYGTQRALAVLAALVAVHVGVALVMG